MKVAIPAETAENEKRVAATPETVKKMIASGLKVTVQAGAGKGSFISDEEYKEAGAGIEADAGKLLKSADIVLKVQRPLKKGGKDELSQLREGACLIGLLQPLVNTDLVQDLTGRKITALSLDMIPRIARAQRLDALSSQSNIAGYKAALMGADALRKMMPLMMTAAGTVSAARVLVLGAGVAGLQAIATAKRLGAIVEAFDTRPVVKEQVESLGGKFLELDLENQETEDRGGYAKELSKEQHEKEMELIARHARNADIVITTAQIPGRKSPLLVTEQTVKEMKPGSVIVDLAVEGGGNCEATEPGKTVEKHGVTLIGLHNIPSLMATQASQLYARNIGGLLGDIIKDGTLQLDPEDEVIKGALITRDGEVVHEMLKEKMRESGEKA